MKRYFLHPALAMILIVIFSGCHKEKEAELLATKIQYDVQINSADPQVGWWVNNLEGSKRDPFINRIMKAAENGDLQAYDYFNKPLTPQQVKSMQIDTVYRTLTHPYPPYDQYDTVVYFTLDYNDITKIRFLEEWRWNPKTLEIDKKVVGIAPVAVIKYGDKEYNRPLFWIYPDNNYPEKE